MTVTVSQNSFVGGEWAPSLSGRSDLAKYATAVRKMRNVFPHPHGGASNRGGTEFITEAVYSNKKARLVPFQYSVVQGYILEFGDQYVRPLKDGALIEESAGVGTDIKAAAYKWTASGSGTDEYYLELAAGGYPGFDYPYHVYEDVGGADTDMPEGTLGSLAAGEWGYGDNDTLGYNTIYVRLTDGVDPDTKANGYLEAGYLEEVTTPYLEADLPLLKFAQNEDYLYITHPNYAPRKLTRAADDNWSLSTISFGASIAAPTGLSCGGTGTNYVVTAVNDVGEESVASSAKEGAPNNNLTWNAVTGADYYNVYKDSNGSGVYGWIGQANATTFKEPTATINPDYTKTPPDANAVFGSSGNYPGCCAFFEQRMVYARTDNAPQTVFGSTVGVYDNFNSAIPIKDDDSYEFTINARQVNEIRWLVPMEQLVLGASNSEWNMSAGGYGDAVTPTNVNMKQKSQWGVSHVPPLVIGNTILFLTASKKTVRDLAYSLEADGYTGMDLSILANHLFRNYEINEWAYQSSPDSIVWAVRNDGMLLGLTYYKEHEVWGWHQHDTQGYFESVASILNDDGGVDVYVLVRRTINGQIKRYIELFRERLPHNVDYETDIADAFFVDSGLSYDGWNTDTAKTIRFNAASTWTAGSSGTLTAVGHQPFSNASVGKYFKLKKGSDSVYFQVTAYLTGYTATAKIVNRPVPNSLRNVAVLTWARMATALSGLDHLEGMEVVALCDGNVVSNLTVSSGSVTFPNPFAKAHVGLSYTSDIETLDYEYQAESGSVQDKLRSIVSVVLRLEDTRGLFVGPSEDRLTEIAFRENEDYGEPTELFTDDKEVSIEAGDIRRSRVFLRNVDPVPFTLLALLVRMDHGEA